MSAKQYWRCELSLPENVAEGVQVKIEIEVQVKAQIFHEVLEFSHVLDGHEERIELRSREVIEECSDFGISDDGVEENVQFAFQIHEIEEHGESPTKALTFNLSTTYRSWNRHRSRIVAVNLRICCCKQASEPQDD